MPGADRPLKNRGKRHSRPGARSLDRLTFAARRASAAMCRLDDVKDPAGGRGLGGSVGAIIGGVERGDGRKPGAGARGRGGSVGRGRGRVGRTGGGSGAFRFRHPPASAARPGDPAAPQATCSGAMAADCAPDRFALTRAAGSPGLRRAGAACRRMTKGEGRGGLNPDLRAGPSPDRLPDTSPPRGPAIRDYPPRSASASSRAATS